ncbi:hypothetical protein NL532_24105 [Mesorhizobium sp. C120A]|uniref:hypothetical protein n=1 Tax=unclassified Mesorhizobium TaxID=325217 RepID=UPI0004CE3123|nr:MULTISPECIES: hypothetical protein [unclassified Mesorhizobium]WJI43693.1 hypothetical protein NL532_24105 [Mesorhizobium sp. C120A]
MEIIIDVEIDKMQVTHDGQIFPIVALIDDHGEDTPDPKTAAVIVYGKEGVGFRVFDIREGREGLAGEQGVTPATKVSMQ